MHQINILLTLFYSKIIVLALQGSSECRESRSERGVALLHAAYSSKEIQRYFDCVHQCINDPPCMSINYWWDTRKCDLNYKTKEYSCRACFVVEPYSTYMGIGKPPGNRGYTKSCTALKRLDPALKSGGYVIDPDGEGGFPPFDVTCNMTDKNGVGVTVISHDSESRTRVQGYEEKGRYSRDIYYTGANLSQLANLATVSAHCEQFIRYECYGSVLWFNNDPYGWWVSRDSTKMTYWGGRSPGSAKCTCDQRLSCANLSDVCNCDKNDNVWREDSGLLTDKQKLPVKQLRFGDTGHTGEQGYHTLGKFKCYGTA